MMYSFLTYCFSICFIFLLGLQSRAQQTPQVTQWSSNQLYINPAHSGIKPCADIHTLYRMQWIGFDGAPKTGILTFTAPIKTKRREFLSARQGIGFRFENDQIGHFSTNRINLSYAAHFNFTQDTRLSLGLYAGMIQVGFDASNSKTIDPDPAVHKEANFIVPDAAFGAWWNGKNYYLGLTLQNLIHSTWTDLGNDSKYHFHTLFNGGYRQRINDNVTLMPAFLIKIPPHAKYALDIQAMIDFANKVNLGIGYRNTDAILCFAGFKLNQQLSIQYSFDYTLSAIKIGSNNTHEVSISYTTCKPENKDKTRCPLFD